MRTRFNSCRTYFLIINLILLCFSYNSVSGNSISLVSNLGSDYDINVSLLDKSNGNIRFRISMELENLVEGSFWFVGLSIFTKVFEMDQSSDTQFIDPWHDPLYEGHILTEEIEIKMMNSTKNEFIVSIRVLFTELHSDKSLQPDQFITDSGWNNLTVTFNPNAIFYGYLVMVGLTLLVSILVYFYLSYPKTTNQKELKSIEQKLEDEEVKKRVRYALYSNN